MRKWYETGESIPHTNPMPEGPRHLTLWTTASGAAPITEASGFGECDHTVRHGLPGHGRVPHPPFPSMGAKAQCLDPSWGARTEGLARVPLATSDGTVLTLENLRLIKRAVHPAALWQVRAHRGLNTPETVVLAHLAGADLSKVNIVYGSLGAGTDPTRLAVDGVECLRLAAEFGLPYDVVTNEELCGVPARKAFAGMLVVATAGALLGGRPSCSLCLPTLPRRWCPIHGGQLGGLQCG